MPSASTSADYVLAELRAKDLQLHHDYKAAASAAAEAAEVAHGLNDARSWWSMNYLRAECLRDSGSVADCAAIARTLADHPIASDDAASRSRALILLAIALQGTGQLEEAVAAAAAAAKAVAQHEDCTDLSIEAQRALIAAWAESGKIEDAWRECRVLAQLITDIVDEQTAGKAYWVIGNVAFLRNETEDGRSYHDLAAQNFSPTTDLDLWAKFNKASAAMRLAARIADAGTLRCIERAELATEIIGGSPEDHLLLATARAHWHYLTGDHSSAIALLEPVCEQASAIAAQSAAEAFDLLGRSLHAAGHNAKALERLQAAAAYFDLAGAAERSGAMQEFIKNNFELGQPPSIRG